jgi:hypothetical protein
LSSVAAPCFAPPSGNGTSIGATTTGAMPVIQKRTMATAIVLIVLATAGPVERGPAAVDHWTAALLSRGCLSNGCC